MLIPGRVSHGVCGWYVLCLFVGVILFSILLGFSLRGGRRIVPALPPVVEKLGKGGVLVVAGFPRVDCGDIFPTINLRILATNLTLLVNYAPILRFLYWFRETGTLVA